MGNTPSLTDSQPSSQLTTSPKTNNKQNVLNPNAIPDLILFELLSYLPFPSRFTLQLTSMHLNKMLTDDDAYKWYLERLHVEYGIYSGLLCLNLNDINFDGAVDGHGGSSSDGGSISKGKGGNKTLFKELYKRRNLWIGGNNNNDGSGSGNGGEEDEERDLPNWKKKPKPKTTENFNITVCARFKPLDKNTSLNSNDDDDDGGGGKKVTLPLHQRLQLIKLSTGVKSNKDAIRILRGEGNWFKGLPSSTSSSSDSDNDKENSNNVNGINGINGGVGARSGMNELKTGIHLINSENNTVVVVDKTRGLKRFGFDFVFDLPSSPSSSSSSSSSPPPPPPPPPTTAPSTNTKPQPQSNNLKSSTPAETQQHEIYQNSTSRLVLDFLNGYNATVAVYGQTGSGKTFTMFGPDPFSSVDVSSASGEKMRGIVPRVCAEVLTALDYRASSSSNLNITLTSTLSVSYIEIYGDTVTDLLNRGQLCGHSKVSAQRFVLNGSSSNLITSIADVERLLVKGEGEKRKAKTAMNDRSSRAHCVFVLTLEQGCVESGVSARSRLFLADLGGSEQVKKSQVEVGSSAHMNLLKSQTLGDAGKLGAVLNKTNIKVDPTSTSATSATTDDTANIDTDTNQPLPFPTTQTQVRSNTVRSYSTGFKKSERMREAVYINLGLLALKKCVEALNFEGGGYVPYSDSKLTMLLSSGLGGDSKCAVIVCASKEERHLSETVAALRFGEACRKISKTVKTNVTLLASLLTKLDLQIKECEAQIILKERWEITEITRKDERVEQNTLESLGFGGIETSKVTVLTGAEIHRTHLLELLRQRCELTGTTLSSDFGGSKFGGSVGFGSGSVGYGLGSTSTDTSYGTDSNDGNYRFADAVDTDAVPDSIKSAAERKGGKVGWSGEGGGKEDQRRLEIMAKKKNRNRSAYAGISS